MTDKTKILIKILENKTGKNKSKILDEAISIYAYLLGKYNEDYEVFFIPKDRNKDDLHFILKDYFGEK